MLWSYCCQQPESGVSLFWLVRQRSGLSATYSLHAYQEISFVCVIQVCTYIDHVCLILDIYIQNLLVYLKWKEKSKSQWKYIHVGSDHNIYISLGWYFFQPEKSFVFLDPEFNDDYKLIDESLKLTGPNIK